MKSIEMKVQNGLGEEKAKQFLMPFSSILNPMFRELHMIGIQIPV